MTKGIFVVKGLEMRLFWTIWGKFSVITRILKSERGKGCGKRRQKTEEEVDSTTEEVRYEM